MGDARVKRKRRPVTRERVLDAAMAIADRDGIDAVTMRAVAARLGVEAMSLYKHVANKDDVLDGLVQRVMAEMALPPSPVEWREGLVLRARGMREVLLAHRWAPMLIESRTAPVPARLRHHDTSLGLLRDAGFSVELAYRAILALDSYIYGFVAQEVWWPFTGEDLPAMVETLVPTIDPATYPHLVEVAGFVAGRRTGFDADFELGLGLLLDGLARARRADTGRRRPRARRAADP